VSSHPRRRLSASNLAPVASSLISHITGGGIAANLARVLPKNTTLDVDRSTWRPADVFQVLTSWANLDLTQVESTWNLGLGFAVSVKADKTQEIQQQLNSTGINTWQLGLVESTDCSLEGYIQGPKGVEGGAVRLGRNAHSGRFVLYYR